MMKFTIYTVLALLLFLCTVWNMNLDESNTNSGVSLKRPLKDYTSPFLDKLELLPSDIGFIVYTMKYKQDLDSHDLSIHALFDELIKLYQIWVPRKRYIFDSIQTIHISVKGYRALLDESYSNQDSLMFEIVKLVGIIDLHLVELNEFISSPELSSLTKQVFSHFDSFFLSESIFLDEYYKHISQVKIITALLLVQLAYEYISLLEPIFDTLNYEINKIEMESLDIKSPEVKHIKHLHELYCTTKIWFKEARELTDGIILFQDLYLSICFLLVDNFKEKHVWAYKSILENVNVYKKVNGRLVKTRKGFFKVQERFMIAEEGLFMAEKEYENAPTKHEVHIKAQKAYIKAQKTYIKAKKRQKLAQKAYEKAQKKSNEAHKKPKLWSNCCPIAYSKK